MPFGLEHCRSSRSFTLLMLEHVATGLGTVAACLCAFLHVRVLGGLCAGGSANVASLHAGLTYRDSHRTVPGNDLGCGPAKLRAICTSLHGRQMRLLP